MRGDLAGVVRAAKDAHKAHFEALFGPKQWTADCSPGGALSSNSSTAFIQVS